MPTEASDANVSVPLFVRAEDSTEDRASLISAHVVDAILRRSCRDTLLSLSEFGKHGLFAQKAKVAVHALRFIGLKPPTPSPSPSTPRPNTARSTITTPASSRPSTARRPQNEVLEERRKERQAKLDATPLKPKRTTVHIDLTIHQRGLR
jgi:hypothetical protein